MIYESGSFQEFAHYKMPGGYRYAHPAIVYVGPQVVYGTAALGCGSIRASWFWVM